MHNPVKSMSRDRGAAPAQRWAGLSGRSHGDPNGRGCPIVLLHGLTFDHRMWDPVASALPSTHRAIAFDLPDHGESRSLPQPGLGPVVDAIHDAVLDAGLDAPIIAGHSIGGPIASIYAATYPAAAVVSVDAPVRFEPFVQLLQSLRAQLTGDGFAQAWSMFQSSFHVELLPTATRALVQGAERTTDDLQRLFLAYQSDLLERPLEDVVRWRDDGLLHLRAIRMPYVTLHASPIDRSDRAWLIERIPQAEILVWPAGHHFPHLSDPARFAALLTGLAAAPSRGAQT
jgi:pimeloyl-ACP methyl ester carboxylesterase